MEFTRRVMTLWTPRRPRGPRRGGSTYKGPGTPLQPSSTELQVAPLDDGVPESIQGPGEEVLQAEELPAVPVEMEFQRSWSSRVFRVHYRPDVVGRISQWELSVRTKGPCRQPFCAWDRSCVVG